MLITVDVVLREHLQYDICYLCEWAIFYTFSMILKLTCKNNLSKCTCFYVFSLPSCHLDRPHGIKARFSLNISKWNAELANRPAFVLKCLPACALWSFCQWMEGQDNIHRICGTFIFISASNLLSISLVSFYVFYNSSTGPRHYSC